MTGRDWTDADITAMFERVENWGRWGSDDEKGTLNYILRPSAARAPLPV
jgi:hypothetical protein